MKPISFYPGPSEIYPEIPQYVEEAYQSGILSANHRSESFMTLMAETKAVLREKLAIPSDYEIGFVSSATECWEILGQSLIQKASQHFFNGAFGEKWSDTLQSMGVDVERVEFGINDTLPAEKIDRGAECICITACETSNGTFVSNDVQREIRGEERSNQLIAVDATSALGGACLDFEQADYWFASVQKCLGLPAGMGILILSPRAIQRAREIGDKRHYNSLLKIIDNSKANQTHYTPNVLDIYLLHRTQQNADGIVAIEERLKTRYQALENVLKRSDGLFGLVTNPTVQSHQVTAILAEGNLDLIKSKASQSGIVLGNGYGPWKSNSFRIANFPAIDDLNWQKLISFLSLL